MALATVCLCLAALAVQVHAESAPAITMDRAVAQFGTPTYDHNCHDGTLTLGWKGRGAEAARRPALFGTRWAQHRGAVGAGAGSSTLVMKFDPRGTLVWARQVR
jgi:hypothetical protein